MGNSRIKFSRICYLVTGISMILIIAILSNYFRDMEKTSWEVRKEIQIGGARVAAGYIEDLFNNRKASLTLLGDSLADIDISNKMGVEERILSESGLFDNITLVDTKGSKIYGNSVGENVQNDKGFERALLGECVVSEEITVNDDQRQEVRLYAPVMGAEEEGIKAVLVASILCSTLGNHIESISSDSDKCVAIMSNRGSILYGSSNLTRVLGKPGSSYFSYIRECDIFTAGVNDNYIQSSIRERQEIFLEYKYDHKSYIATCIPVRINESYLIYMTTGEGVGLDKNVISESSWNMLKVFVLDLVIVFAMLIYYMRSRTKTMKLLDNYSILDKQERAVLFEYTFYPKKVEVFGDVSMLLGNKFKTLIGEAVYDVYDCVHEDDTSIRGRLHEFFDSTEKVFSSEIRLIDKDGNYGWYRITGTIFRDNTGRNIRFVGKLINANRQISMEKSLVQRAENDLLTGVLNKKTIESKIAELLSNKSEDRYYIFYMVDLDNFKNVNDTLGHIYGDRAIADTAKVLQDIFHSNALIGRLGGDEFAVCVVYDAFDEESLMKFIIKNAERVCAANRREYSDGASTVKISSSIGIAVAPKDGQNFEILYKRADEALYNSKNTGKNKYTLYERK